MFNLIHPFPSNPLAISLVDSGIFPILVVIAICLLGGLLAYVGYRRQKARREQFQRIAENLDLRYEPKDETALRQGLSHFHLFSQGRGGKIQNILRGKVNGSEFAVFDYSYTAGGGRNSRVAIQSVIYFRNPQLRVPQFSLRPEGLFHKMGEAIGYQDIDFETHPEFSKSYLLRGENESRVRDVFRKEVLTFFESQSRVSVEGNNDQLLFFRSEQQIQPEGVEAFIAQGTRVFRLFGGTKET